MNFPNFSQAKKNPRISFLKFQELKKDQATRACNLNENYLLKKSLKEGKKLAKKLKQNYKDFFPIFLLN